MLRHKRRENERESVCERECKTREERSAVPSLLHPELQTGCVQVHRAVDSLHEREQTQRRRSTEMSVRSRCSTFFMISKNFRVSRPREQSNRELLSSPTSAFLEARCKVRTIIAQQNIPFFLDSFFSSIGAPFAGTAGLGVFVGVAMLLPAEFTDVDGVLTL